MPGGLVDAKDQRLTQAELRPLTGAEEDWLAAHPDVPSAIAVTRVLAACLIRLGSLAVNVDLVRRLLIGDRDFLMLQLRRITLGDHIQAVLPCPACQAKMDIDFHVQDVPVEARPQTALNYQLEHAGRTIRFRLPVGGDQEAVLNIDRARASEVLLQRCVLDDDKTLTPETRAALINAMDRLAPQIDVDLNLTCPECKHAFVAPFDTTAFFLQEIRIGGHQLLREAHLLAFYYHWNETEIMSLRRDRRRAYLALLRDDLRPQ